MCESGCLFSRYEAIMYFSFRQMMLQEHFSHFRISMTKILGKNFHWRSEFDRIPLL